jgi:hypothetical protein
MNAISKNSIIEDDLIYNIEANNCKRNKFFKFALLFILFFMICFGIGYPTLNRYDPSMVKGISDSQHYFKMVKTGIRDVVGHWRYRVMIPYSAKPIYWLVKDRIGTWNPLSFSLLFINSLFCAASALTIILIGLKIIRDFAISLTGALLFLLSFTVSNGHLAGLVDSGETCFLLVMTLAMITNRWYYLPIIGILGAMTKETFVPLSGSLAIAFWFFDNKDTRQKKSSLYYIIIMVIMGLCSVITIRSIILGTIVWPWEIIGQEKRSLNIIVSLFMNLIDKSFWYNYFWLLPFGVIFINYLPRPLLYAYCFTAFITLLLGAWNNSGGGNIGRALFNIIGPAMNLSVAILIFTIFKKK